MGMIGNTLAQGLISGANIQDGTVDTADIKSNAITPSKLSIGAPSWDTSSNLNIGFSGSSYIPEKLRVFSGASFVVNNAASSVGTYGPSASISALLSNNWKTNLIFKVNTSDTDAAPTEAGRFDANGNFGVGATTLNLINGTRCVTINAPISGNYSSVELASAGVLNGYFSSNGSQTYIGTSSSTPLAFVTAGSERARVDTAGNFAVGLTPSIWNAGGKMIEVGNAGNILYGGPGWMGLSNNAYYNSGWKFASASSARASYYEQTGGGHSWVISTGAGTAGNSVSWSSVMNLDTNGNLYMNPSARSGAENARLTIRHDTTSLDVRNYMRFNNRVYGTTGHTVGGILFSAYRDVRDPCDIAAITAFRTSAAGGLSSDGYLQFRAGGGNSLEVDGVLPGVCAEVYGSGNFRIFGSDATKSSGTAWINPSDQRLKDNIQAYDKGLAELMQIQVRTWEYNGKAGTKAGHKAIGVVADEIMLVLPDTVSTYSAKLDEADEEEVDVKKFDATEVTWLLVNTVQQQQAIIEQMQTRLAALEGA